MYYAKTKRPEKEFDMVWGKVYEKITNTFSI